jgi:hypothetical protein
LNRDFYYGYAPVLGINIKDLIVYKKIFTRCYK